MTPLRPILREMRFRAVNTILLLSVVALSSAFLTAVFLLFNAYDRDTATLLDTRKEAIHRQAAEMAEEYRKIGVGMGFNVLILPAGQNLADFYADDFASRYMPEAYADSLANSKIVSVRHLLPSLSEKVVWPEQRRKIILTGVRGEVPRMHMGGAEKKPILDAVPPGTIVLGAELCRSLDLREGSGVVLKGKKFTVHKCHEERGNHDDITAWINLTEAQQMLTREGKINAILALECRCVGEENLVNMAKVRQDVQSVLPGTQVIEFMSKAIARAEGRWKVVKVAQEAMDAEEAQRAAVRLERERTAAYLIPAVLLSAALLVGVLSFANARARRTEIGILCAIGIDKPAVFLMLFVKALLLSVVGSVAGEAAGVLLFWLRDGAAGLRALASAVDIVIMLRVTGIAVLVTVLGAWLPALAALNEDPARILGEE